MLVRGSRSVVGGGGCCSGDVRPFDEGGVHGHLAAADEVGATYRALRRTLPAGARLEVVSPSNWLWLLPVLVRDGRRRGLRGHALWHSVRAGLAASSLVVDGRVLFSGRLPPEPEVAVLAVLQALQDSGTTSPVSDDSRAASSTRSTSTASCAWTGSGPPSRSASRHCR